VTSRWPAFNRGYEAPSEALYRQQKLLTRPTQAGEKALLRLRLSADAAPNVDRARVVGSDQGSRRADATESRHWNPLAPRWRL
jgi:hypothetical protein